MKYKAACRKRVDPVYVVGMPSREDNPDSTRLPNVVNVPEPSFAVVAQIPAYQDAHTSAYTHS